MFKLTPHHSIKSALVATTIALTTFAMSAQATPITWTFNNATIKQTDTFDFSGTTITNIYNYVVSGSFSYDADTKQSSNANISFTYTSPFNTASTTYTSNKVAIDYDTLNNQTKLTFSEAPAFRFDGMLTNAGGTKTFLNYNPSTIRAIISTGTLTASTSAVSAVPVPAAAWLFGSGLVGLAGLRRRQQSV